MYEWHIGDPVDWGDGFMDAQNQGYGNDDVEDDHFPDKLEADKYSRKAWEKLEHQGNYPGFHGKVQRGGKML